MFNGKKRKEGKEMDSRSRILVGASEYDSR